MFNIHISESINWIAITTTSKMGVTKKPASICSDELLPIEVEDPRYVAK